MPRYIVTTVYEDGIKQQNHYSSKDYACEAFLAGASHPDIIKSIWVYDSVERSVILDSRQK